MKKLLNNAKPGLYLSLAAAAVALLGSIAYVIIYMATAGAEVDRVFSWLVFGLVLGGAVVTVLGEWFDFPFTPILGGACFAVAFAKHMEATAYPLADVLTGVPFFGGNATLAIAFAAVFGVAALLNIVAAFMDHRKKA